jgi:hypothetical protein
MADDIPKPRSGLTSRIAKIASTDIKQLGTTKIVIIIAVFLVCFFLVVGVISFMMLSSALGFHYLENKEDVFKAFISEKIPTDVAIIEGWGYKQFGGDEGRGIFVCSPETLDALIKELEMKDITREFHEGPYKDGDKILIHGNEGPPWWDLKYSKELKAYERDWEKRAWMKFYYISAENKCYFTYYSTS